MKRLLTAIAALACVSAAYADTLQPGRTLKFSMQDYLDLPTYSWPETMVGYQVEFNPAITSVSEISLTDSNTGRAVPFQLTSVTKKNGRISAARLCFISSLGSGESFSYTLKYSKSVSAVPDSGCSLVENDGMFHADNGCISVVVPKDGLRDGRCMFEVHDKLSMTSSVASLNAGRLNLVSGDTRVVETGPIMSKMVSRYKFSNGASYELSIILVKGYPFVILEENVDAIKLSDDVRADMVWNGIDLKYRFGAMWDRTIYPGQSAWLDIDKPVYTNYSKEDPFWSGQGMIEKPAEKMVFRLASFGGNSVREQVPMISFWGDGPVEIGTFVYDHEKWDDRQYGIWQQTPDLSVYFKYCDNHLHFMYPIASGQRSTAVAIHNREAGEMECARFSKALDTVGGDLRSTNTRFRYMNLLHSRYALLNLDKVKEWQLEYPDAALRKDFPFVTPLSRTSPDMFMKEMRGSAMGDYMCGLNGYPGIHSIAHRPYYGRLMQGYQMNYEKLSPAQKKQAEALFLIAGYVNMMEAMNAIRTCLAGTANMAADGWVVPAMNAAMFPEHKMAPVWKEFFEKSLEIYALYYTRPEVKAYDSKGGRWVESLGIYNWAYLKPTITANIALQSTFGTNSFANSYMASRGRWMVDMLTAPVLVAKKGESTEELQRVYTAHGAHSGGRFVEQFSQLYQYGKYMENYDPILAENIYWCGKYGRMNEGKKGETSWDEVFMAKNDCKNTGTNPHLKSEKYTGHGIVLRSDVGTPDELSIHLDQVDKGPNYRWGNQANGNSGGIYFYAAGKIYSGHENEAAGDHSQNDMDNVCNMGFMKNGRFQSVGYNELTEPLYDFGFAQFAEVKSVAEPGLSSWPEYESRSVMLAGSDYFMLYDNSCTNWRANNRFSWFVQKVDTLPYIIFFDSIARTDHWTTASTNNSYGFYRDAIGSQLTLITHKGDIRPLGGTMYQPEMMKQYPVFEFKRANRNYPYIGVVELQSPASRDVVFRNGKGIDCHEKFYSFVGEAGIARKKSSGEIQLAIFKGKSISFGQYSMVIDSSSDCAAGMCFYGKSKAEGDFQNYGKATLTIAGLEGGKFYIDGRECISNSGLINLPEGKHHLEYVVGDARPMPSEIVASEYGKNNCRIFIKKAESAAKVAVELSYDGGLSWSRLAETDTEEYLLTNLKKGKCHVRVLSLNGSREALSAQEYPVYVNNQAPHYPDGLQLRIHDGVTDLSWGRVLGVRKYLLYRKVRGSDKFELIYEGESTSFCDCASRNNVCDRHPSDISGGDYTQYYVLAENGRGRSDPSPVIYANPSSWKAWYPSAELKFKRRSAFWAEPYVNAEDMPQMYYPD